MYYVHICSLVLLRPHLWPVGLLGKIDIWKVRLNCFRVNHQHISLRRLLVVVRDPFRSSLLFFEDHIGDMFFNFFGVQDQPVPFFRICIGVVFLYCSSFHFFEIDIGQMRFEWLWIYDEVVAIIIPFRFGDGVYECFLLHFSKISIEHMWINSLELHLILPGLGTFLLNLQVLFKPPKFQLVGLVLFECHIFSQKHILGNFSLHTVQITIVEHPVLREKDLLWKMLGLYVGRGFVQRSREVGVHRLERGKIDSVVGLFDLDAVVLPVVFGSDLLIGNDPHVSPLLHQFEQTVVKAGSSLQGGQFIAGQPVILMHWIDDDISSFFHYLLLNLVGTVVVLDLLLLKTLSFEGKPHSVRSEVVIRRVVIIRPRLHLRKPKRFGSRSTIDGPTGSFHLCRDILFEPSPEVVHPPQHHEESTSFLLPLQFGQVEVLFPHDRARVVFEQPIELQRDVPPIDKLQPFPELLLPLSRYQLFGLGNLRFHDRAHRRSFLGLVFVDEERSVLVFHFVLLETVVLREQSVSDSLLLLGIVEPWSPERV